MRDRAAGQELARPGKTAETCGQVERAAAVAVSNRNRFTRVEANSDVEGKLRMRRTFVSQSRLELEAGEDRLAGRFEDRQRFVST
jgi:hypothetical protein